MKTIILIHYYPHLTERIMLEVSDEIAVTLSIGGRLCDSYKRRNIVFSQRGRYNGRKAIGPGLFLLAPARKGGIGYENQL